MSDAIKHAVDKVFVGLTWVDISALSLGTDEDGGRSGSRVNGRDIAHDLVGGNVFVTTGDVGGRKRGLVALLEECTCWHVSALGSDLKGFLDDVDWKPGKHRLELGMIWFTRFDFTRFGWCGDRTGVWWFGALSRRGQC